MERHAPGINEQIVHDADTLETRHSERLKFLTDAKLDKVKVDDVEAARGVLIADAALFIELTQKKAEEGDDGKPPFAGRAHFETRLQQHMKAARRFGAISRPTSPR